MERGFRLGEGHNSGIALLVLVGIVVGLLSLSNVIAGAFAALQFGSLEHFQEVVTGSAAMSDSERTIILVVQAVVALCTFVLGPFAYIRGYERKEFAVVSPRPIQDPLELLWPVLLIPAFAPMLELIVEWNKGMDLPDALGGLEQWAFTKEQQLEELTRQITSFSSTGQFLLGLLVIAVLPALGEELLFRGTIQPLLQRSFNGNKHAAIWATAILFSAIHVQFYGFVPRMLLGLLFGYLYVWSGNLWVPILSHFTNNAITVCLLYLHKTGSVTFDPENLPQAPLPVLLGSAAVGGLVLWRFRERYFVREE